MSSRGTVLVTGAGGFIGHHLTLFLKKRGYWVRGVDIKHPEYAPTEADEFEILDLRRWDNCLQATHGVDEVYALAADMGGMGFISAHHSQILHNNGLINFHTLEAARIKRVKRYLYTSSACIYPEYLQTEADVRALREEDAYPAAPQDAYGWEKLITERLCTHYREDYGIETRIVRFHNIFGPLGTWEGGREKAPAAMCRKVAVAKLTGNPEVKIWGDGEQTRSFCYIDDCVTGIYKLMRSDHAEPLNLGQDRLVSINQLADLVATAAGIQICKRHVSGPQGVARAELGQLAASRGSPLGTPDLAGGGAAAHVPMDRRAGPRETGREGHQNGGVRLMPLSRSRLDPNRSSAQDQNRAPPLIRRCNVLGVGVSAINPSVALETIGKWIDYRECHYVCITGVHGVMESQRDPQLKHIHNRAGLVTPDGMPLVWISRLRGFRGVDRVYGPDLMLAISGLSAERGFRYFLYGGREGVAERLSARLRGQFPGLQVVGTYCPPFRPLTEEEDARVMEMINQSGADIVWVGLSTPKQEHWMAAHLGKIKAPVMIGVGAAFDIHAGLVLQAPRWMQRFGLEWLFRLLIEPRRLWRRYLVNNPIFVTLILLQLIGLRRLRFEDGGIP